MPCEHYKDALIEAAAYGAALADAPASDMRMTGLRAHLESCPSCRAAFAQEQSIFAAIDSGLHAAANSAVSPSLLPRIRAGLDEAAPSRLPWVRPLVFVSAGAALMLVVFLLARPHQAGPKEVAKQSPAVTTAATTPATDTNSEKTTSGGTQSAAVHAGHSYAARSSTIPHAVASSSPEVLVPPSEREAFARFVATLNKHSGEAVDLLAHAPEKENALVSGDQLQIPDIEIKPLEGTQAETSDGASEKR